MNMKFLAISAMLLISMIHCFTSAQNRCDTLKFFNQGSMLTGYLYSAEIIDAPLLLFTQGFMGTGDFGILGELFISNPDLRMGYSDSFQKVKKPYGPVDFQFTDDPTEELLTNLEYFCMLKKTDKLANTDNLLTGGTDDTTVSLEDHMLPLYRALNENKKQKSKIYYLLKLRKA